MYSKGNFIDVRHRVQHDGEPESSAVPGWAVRHRREAHRFVVPMGLYLRKGATLNFVKNHTGNILANKRPCF
jgi:hypothetical protein